MKHSSGQIISWVTKKSLKLRIIEIISGIFSGHKAMRLDISYGGGGLNKHKHMEAKQCATK